MKTRTIAGLKVYDYSKKAAPVRTPHENIKPIIAGFDLAFGKDQTVVTRAEQVESEHRARYSDKSLEAAEFRVVEKLLDLDAAKKAARDIAEQLLWEHEGPYYHYCATGHSGRYYTEYQDGTPWAKRREYLNRVVDMYDIRPKPAIKQKRPTLVKRLHTWWSTRNEPAND